jgi:hypothetical protein
VALEDSCLSGLDALSVSLPSDQQQQLLQCTEEFNQLACEFQDTWPEHYWDMYELIRGGYENVESMQALKSSLEINSTVAEVQELALRLNQADHKSVYLEVPDGDALKDVDNLAKQYENSTLLEEVQQEEKPQQQEKCCKCVIW